MLTSSPWARETAAAFAGGGGAGGTGGGGRGGGGEVWAATAAEAKSVLANEEAYYVIAVEKLPRMGMGRPGAEGL